MKTSKMRQLRIERGMKQKEMAALVGSHPTHYGQIERGVVMPWPALRKKVAVIFGLPEEEIFGAEESTSRNLIRSQNE